MEIYNVDKVKSILQPDTVLEELLEKVYRIGDGEGIFIADSEWTRKTPPKETLYLRKINLKQKKLDTGWLLYK